MRTSGELEVETALFEDDGQLPNSRLPVILYRGAIAAEGPDPAAVFEHRFFENDWTNSWCDGIYTFHHYHSTSHEVLGIARAGALLRLGGREGRDFEVQAGDVIVLPAGTGHRRLSAQPGLQVVGAYPEGRSWDLIKPYEAGAATHDAALARIAAIPRPRLDPVLGKGGPLNRLWASA